MESAELFLRSIVETANDAIITSDSGGNITSWNQAAVDIFGYSHDEIMGKPVITIMPQRFHVAHRKGMRRVTTTGESHIIGSTVEVLGLRKDGSEIPLELSLAKCTIKDGRFFTAIIRGITKRKRVEEALQESEENYRDIVELAPDGIVTVDIKGVVTSCNTAFSRLMGFSKEEIVGKHFSKLPTANVKDIPQYFKIFASLLKGKESKPMELAWTHKDGTQRLCEFQGSLMKRDNKIVGLQAIARDITERKRVEEVLKESEEKFSRAFHSNPHPMSIVTLEEGYYLDVNDSYVQTFGFSREELLGRTTVEMGILKNDRARRRILQSLREEQTVKNLEMEFHTRSGRKVETLLSGDKMEIGGQTCLLSVITDITERKQIERNLGERVKELDCLYGIAEIVGKPSITLGEILQETVNLIPPSWQYPEVTCTRIQLADKEFKTDNFKPSQWRQSADIVVNGQKEGTLEVYYLAKKPESDEGPFLKEERLLIDAIAERLVRITERRRVEEEIKRTRDYLEKLNDSLEEVIFNVTFPGRTIEYVNRAVETVLGYRPDECLGRNTEFLFKSNKDYLEIGRKLGSAAEGNKPGLELEFQVRNKDGEAVDVDINFTFIKEQGELTRVISVFRDVTERKQAGEKRTQLIQELQETLKEVRTLSGLLPIRAWCNKLRDDEGYWKSGEQYIGERTKAKFTHGMCPECQSKFLSERNSNTKAS